MYIYNLLYCLFKPFLSSYEQMSHNLYKQQVYTHMLRYYHSNITLQKQFGYFNQSFGYLNCISNIPLLLN